MINSAAKRYSTALYSLATEENKSEVILKGLEKVEEILENKELYSALVSPLVTTEEKEAVVSLVFTDIDEYVQNFLLLLCSKGRMDIFSDCLADFKAMYNKDNNILEVKATVATSLSEGQKDSLKAALGKKYNKTINLKEEIDESIVAGVHLSLDNGEVLSSVKSRLSDMEKILKQNNM